MTNEACKRHRSIPRPQRQQAPVPSPVVQQVQPLNLQRANQNVVNIAPRQRPSFVRNNQTIFLYHIPQLPPASNGGGINRGGDDDYAMPPPDNSSPPSKKQKENKDM